MRSFFFRAIVALALTLLLARLDQDVTSFGSLVRLENVPALLIYGAIIFGLVTVVGAGLRRLALPR